MWQWTPFTLPTLLSGLAGLGVAAFAWARRNESPAARPLGATAALTALWTLAYAGLNSRTDLAGRELFLAIEYPFVLLTPAAALLLALRQSSRKVGWAWRAALWAPPTLALALAATNASHHWMSTPLRLVPYDGYVLSVADGGPAWYVYLLYAYLCVLVTAMIYLLGWIRGAGVERPQSGVLLAGTLVPFIANLLYTFGPMRIAGFDPTPVAFLITSFAYAWGIFRSGLGVVAPVARDAILELLDAAVLLIDARARLVDATSAARRALDVPLTLGRPVAPSLARWPDLAALVASRRGRLDIRLGAKAFEALAMPLDDGGVVLLLADITARKTLEDSTQAALTEATRLSEARAEFLARMSHEVRTPLSALIGSAQLLSSSRSLAPADATRVESLKQASESLLELVDEVLDFSALDAGVVRLAARSFAPRELIDGIGTLFSASARRKGLAFVVESALDDGSLVGDPLRIRQIVANLVTNAIKFTPAGQVTLRAHATPEHDGVRLVVEVVDTGVGLSPEELPRVFEPFVQSVSTAESGLGGTGLGLAISRRLAEAMGGEVRLESTLGRGTRARFEAALPLASSPRRAPPPVTEREVVREALAVAPLASDGGYVLLVEDQPLNRALTLELLASVGCTASGAASAAEVRAAVERALPALVLMDLRLPDGDGRALARELLERHPTLAIVALTADATPAVRASCLEAGMLDHVRKPISEPHLRALLAAHVGASPVAITGAVRVPADARARLFASAGEELAAISHAIEGGRLEVATRLAHGLAGASAIVGEERLARALAELSRSHDADAAAALWAGVHEAWTSARERAEVRA